MSVEGAKQWQRMATERLAEEPLVAIGAALSGLLEVQIDAIEMLQPVSEDPRPMPGWAAKSLDT